MLSKHLLTICPLLAGAWAEVQIMGSTSIGSVTTRAPSPVYTTLSESPTTTSTTGIATHTVNVGASGHKFTPNEVFAEVGDIIEWRFYPDGHWVIRGDFDYPCVPYEYIGTDRTGFSSDAQSVKAITDDGPRYRVRVNDTDPIFFYCGAPGSCTKYHMMGVVNPSSNETLDQWLANADGVDYQLTPGEPWPTEDGLVTPTAGNAPAATGSSSGDHNNGHTGLAPGAIAGIAIGAAAVLLLGAGLVYLCGRRGGFDKAYRKSFHNSTTAPYSDGSPAVAEAQFASPNLAAAGAWTSSKQPSSISAPFGTAPITPQHTPGYGFQLGEGTMTTQDGTIGAYCDVHGRQFATPPPHNVTPKPQPVAPVELPASADPGNSPLPSYSNGQESHFSWIGDEGGYRPSNK
ncbi:hypothetical protein G7046_g71 [Stylonectria norvegica]|nr:hypothetical protein G7046_g71 [Stylonectria norvegica]